MGRSENLLFSKILRIPRHLHNPAPRIQRTATLRAKGQISLHRKGSYLFRLRQNTGVLLRFLQQLWKLTQFRRLQVHSRCLRRSLPVLREVLTQLLQRRLFPRPDRLSLEGCFRVHVFLRGQVPAHRTARTTGGLERILLRQHNKGRDPRRRRAASDTEHLLFEHAPREVE